MKKLMLLIPLALFALSSCKKKECYKCKVKVSVTVNNESPTTTESETSVCDMSEKEIQEYRANGTKQSVDGNKKINTVTTCDKQ